MTLRHSITVFFSSFFFFGAAAGFSVSSSRKCARHFLQMVEYAPRGSACSCPHFGPVTATVLGLVEGGIVAERAIRVLIQRQCADASAPVCAGLNSGRSRL